MAEKSQTAEGGRNQALFAQLVMMFHAAAMQQMGKIMNPITNKIERDLDQARTSIDMLAMIQEKTKGNLTQDESRLLDEVLYQLRMNYVDEVNKPPEKEEKQPETSQ
ncbi:MAG TPA: DUF1844 domain-containing protein [Candidatus Latescibacteria bacterium]|nr:DUF1844 domain-containing protein [Candidatus Latescibacterota bacterium]